MNEEAIRHVALEILNDAKKYHESGKSGGYVSKDTLLNWSMSLRSAIGDKGVFPSELILNELTKKKV